MQCRIAYFLICVLISSVAFAQTKPSPPGGTITPPPRRDVPGVRITLQCGELYIPDYFHANENGKAHLVIWSLGAAWCAEQNFYDSKKNALFVTLNSAWQKSGFPRVTDLQAVIDLVERAQKVARVDKLCLCSFSGGYNCVRDALRLKTFEDRITDVVLADSLYAGHVAPGSNELDPNQMEPFLRFARRATQGEVTFIFSHLYPPEEKYRTNTTTLAAYYLTDQLKVERKPADGKNSAGAMLLYRAEKGNFHVLGYAGMLNQDHFNHFYASADLIRMTSLPDAPK